MRPVNWPFGEEQFWDFCWPEEEVLARRMQQESRLLQEANTLGFESSLWGFESCIGSDENGKPRGVAWVEEPTYVYQLFNHENHRNASFGPSKEEGWAIWVGVDGNPNSWGCDGVLKDFDIVTTVLLSWLRGVDEPAKEVIAVPPTCPSCGNYLRWSFSTKCWNCRASREEPH